MNPIKRAELLFREAKRTGLINPVTKDGMPTIGMITDAINDAAEDAKNCRIWNCRPLPKSKEIQSLRAELKDTMRKWNEAIDGGFKVLNDLDQCIAQRDALRAVCEKQEAALRYWRDECTFKGPSLSVAQRKTDEAFDMVSLLKRPRPRSKPSRKKGGLTIYRESPKYKKSIDKLIMRDFNADISRSTGTEKINPETPTSE